MPKVYDQQLSWNPAGGKRMNLDKIQDLITPALNKATEASNQAMHAMQQIGDRRAASELEAAARDAAEIIDTWDDFSEPDKTIDKMMEAGMKKYDDVMNNLDYATRNRMGIYNPKSREIFELKTREQATKAAFDYSYKDAMANLDKDVGNLITEYDPQNPAAVKGAMDAFLERKKSTMRPADYLAYKNTFKVHTEEGLVEWYLAHGDLANAYASAVSDKITGDVNEVTRARWLKMIESMRTAGSGGGSSSEPKTNFLDVFEVQGGRMDEGLSIMGQMSDYAMSGSALPANLQKYANTILAGGKTYNELMQMPRSQRIDILNANAKTVAEATDLQPMVRGEFLALQSEWFDITDDPEHSGEARKVKKKADITRLKELFENYQNKGYGSYLTALKNNQDMIKAYNEISDLITAEKKAQVLAVTNTGTNMSYVYNNPSMAGFFSTPTPATKEQAKLFNTPEYTQQMSLVNEGMNMVKALDTLNSMAFDDMGNKPVEGEMSVAPADAYFNDGELYKLDSLEKQQKYLNEIVLYDETESQIEHVREMGKKREGGWDPLSAEGYIARNLDVPANRVTKAKNMQRNLDKALDEGKISRQRHAELSRYLYDLSEGKANIAYPCLVPNSKMPVSVWNQCLTSYGFGSVKDNAAYDSNLDRGWHDMAAPLRRSTKTKYKSGEVGDVLQLLTSYVDEAIRVPGNAEHFGLSEYTASAVTPQVITEMYNGAEAKYASMGQIHNLVDLTNNSDIYARKGGEIDGKTWDPAHPSPETTTNILESKQYEMIGVLEDQLTKALRSPTPVRFSEEMKKQMALNVRKVSKGDKGSVKGISEKELTERTNEQTAKTIKGLIGE